MKVLVTGGAGYIGSVVAARLLDAGHEVVVLDDLSTGHRDAVPEGARFERAGLDDARRVLDSSFDAVMHFAAKSLVAESVAVPSAYWHNNVGGSLALLDAMRLTGVDRIVFSSTAATYGEPETMPITERTPAQPINPYGQTKLAVDGILSGYAPAYGLAAVSLRYFNVAGAYGRLGERHDPETHLIPNILAAAAGGAPVTLYGDDYPTADGTAIRDYIHVLDLADAHLAALELTERMEVCNLGSGTGFSVRHVLEVARAVVGRPIPHQYGPRRIGDPPVLVAANRRAADLLGWRPLRGSLDEMIGSAWRLVAHP
jgi:UDP-glucose 4-epimerase